MVSAGPDPVDITKVEAEEEEKETTKELPEELATPIPVALPEFNGWKHIPNISSEGSAAIAGGTAEFNILAEETNFYLQRNSFYYEGPGAREVAVKHAAALRMKFEEREAYFGSEEDGPMSAENWETYLAYNDSQIARREEVAKQLKDAVKDIHEDASPNFDKTAAIAMTYQWYGDYLGGLDDHLGVLKTMRSRKPMDAAPADHQHEVVDHNHGDDQQKQQQAAETQPHPLTPPWLTQEQPTTFSGYLAQKRSNEAYLRMLTAGGILTPQVLESMGKETKGVKETADTESRAPEAPEAPEAINDFSSVQEMIKMEQRLLKVIQEGDEGVLRKVEQQIASAVQEMNERINSAVQEMKKEISDAVQPLHQGIDGVNQSINDLREFLISKGYTPEEDEEPEEENEEDGGTTSMFGTWWFWTIVAVLTILALVAMRKRGAGNFTRGDGVPTTVE